MFNNKFSSSFSILLVAVAFYLDIGLTHATESVQDSERFPSFDNFVIKFNKHYDSKEQFLKKQEIYLSNIEQIKSSNCTSCGVNFYADWTQDQISGLRTVRDSEVKEKIGATANIHTAFSERRLTESVPQTFDWRNVSQITPVKYEGYCGASWAFSTAAFFEQLSIMAGTANQTIDFSEAYLIQCNPENQGCKAGYIESSIDKVIERKGIPLEKPYPFNPYVGVVATVCFETNLFTVPNVSRISYYRIYDPQTIKRIIFKKPVIAAVCGMDLSFYMPLSNQTSGRTLRCKPQNRIIDHSVILVGYTETEWIVKNHWGTGWGLNGYAYISRNAAEDCCIGEQLHSAGTITPNCSVQYCQTCVETDTCYKCQPGRWVKHNTTTGVQTCEICTEANCTECYNYMGSCKWCADGFAMNVTTGKCANATIVNCNMISGTSCTQCKTGYRLNSAKTLCNSYCAVKNCNKCTQGNCSQCKVGFSSVNPVVNESGTQYCLLNPCTVANCSLCNSTGQCITCATSFTLQTSGSCTTNCTAISGCINCLSGSTTCSECLDPKSYNSSKKTCDIFSGTTNCKIYITTCTTCRTGYTLNSEKLCIQTCDSTSCSVCVKTDISICLVCYSGYYLTNTIVNGTTYTGVCVPNPCNITNCTLCGSNGVGCVTCATKYLIYNATSNNCENLCNLTQCRDCLTTGTTAGKCDFCNPGYCVDYFSKLCVPCNISNCLQSSVSSGVQKCWTCMKNYYKSSDGLNCWIYCIDYNCQDCLITSLYACTKCYDGYFMYLVDGSLICTFIYPVVKGCDFVAFNQTYCHYCADFYQKNNQTGLCQLHTKDCPNYCEYCTTNDSNHLMCKCSSGVFEYFSEKCITSPFNDTDCYIVQLYNTTYYCMECLNGKLVNLNETACDPACLITNCTQCQYAYNNYCYICNEGYFLTTTYKCAQCPFENCKTCKGVTKCLECITGYQMDPNQRNCTKILCPKGFLFDGYQCVCPTGTYYTPLSCLPCNQLNCQSCSAIKCYSCDTSYYITSDFKCNRCLPNCKLCSSRNSCNLCVDGYLYDTNTSQCISPSAQGGVFFISQNTVIECPFGCLQCDNVGKCIQCAPGFSTVAGSCLNCQESCKTCQISNSTACTSCQTGYFLNQTSCVKCNDKNCENCLNSVDFCSKCKEGFYIDNNTCKACVGQSCLGCNLYGECTRCASGYVLMANFTCQQCAGDCKACNSSAINQCLVVCNSSQYSLNASCYDCPSKCTSCLSAEVCSSCVAGYVLRNGSCKPVCGEGCYSCEQTNPDVCIQCLAGFVRLQVGLCNPDITCSDNQSCSICPRNWTIVNRTCQICATEGNCIQCAVGNPASCGLCKDGFFLINQICVPCDPTCLKCSSLNRCQLCKEGFLMPQGEFYGSCQVCDPTCKACSDFPKKCTSCKEGYELSVADHCLRVEKIQGQIELDLSMTAFPAVSNDVRNDLLEMMGTDSENGTKYYIITELKEGSIIMAFWLAIPQNQDADTTYKEFRTQLSNMTEVGGVPLIAVRKVELFKPAKNDTNNTTPPENPEISPIIQPQTINKLAIILGVVIPSVIIILAVIAFTFRRKFFKNNNPGIENFSEEVGKQNSSEVVIHVRGKLPPIIVVNNTSFTPLKDNTMDMTGQNKNYFNSTGYAHEQSYSKLDGLNEESRNEFDHTLNNIVDQLNEGYKNKLNVIAEGDKLGDFNEDLSEIKGSRKGILMNEDILQDINNEVMDDIEFDSNTLRNMNEQQQQSDDRIQVKRGEKGHLQIIQLQEDKQQDL